MPAGYYFFGGERTFLTVEKDKYGQEITNYFATSNLLPQQTTLLGMLRHLLLILYGKLDGTQEEKKDLIGSVNFGIEKDSPYGLIDSFSPVILFNPETKRRITPFGFDEQLYADPISELPPKQVKIQYKQEPFPAYLNGLKDSSPALEGFNYKQPISLLWEDENKEIYSEKDLFKKLTKVGVDKKKSDDSFYKQTFVGLKKGFSFGVWVEFNENLDEGKIGKVLMPFGADQGLFKIAFRTDVPNIFDYPESSGSSLMKKIVFLSDAWVDETVLSKVEFGITEFSDFRFIKSKSENFYQLNQGSKSAKYYLMSRGSVLYPGSSFDLTLLNNPAFRRIGYNYFRTI